jgi:hypothetical protein
MPRFCILSLNNVKYDSSKILEILNGEVPLTPVYPYLRAIFSTVE